MTRGGGREGSKSHPVGEVLARLPIPIYTDVTFIYRNGEDPRKLTRRVTFRLGRARSGRIAHLPGMMTFPFSVTARDDETEVSVDVAPASRGPAVYLDVAEPDSEVVEVALSPLACRELATALLVAAHKAEPREAHADALRVSAEDVRR